MYFARILMLAFVAAVRADKALVFPESAVVADAAVPVVADEAADRAARGGKPTPQNVGPGLRGAATEAILDCCNLYNDVKRKCIVPTCMPCVDGAMRLPLKSKNKSATIKGCINGYVCGKHPAWDVSGWGCQGAGNKLAQCAYAGNTKCNGVRDPANCNTPPARGSETWSIKGSNWSWGMDQACFQVNFVSKPDAGCMVKWAQGASAREGWGSAWKTGGGAWGKDLQKKPCTSRGFDSDENEGCKFHPHNGCLYD